MVAGLETKGTRPKNIVGALVHYGKKSLPGMHMWHNGRDACTHGPFVD